MGGGEVSRTSVRIWIWKKPTCRGGLMLFLILIEAMERG